MLLPDHIWRLPPDDLTLSSNEVHIWRSSLNLTASRRETFLSILSRDEMLRAGRFHFEKDRDRFIAGRGWLRTVLSRYLELSPGEIRFSYNPFGKPFLEASLAKDSLRFNLSHSHDLVLCAMGHGREIGIDVERIRPDLSVEHIAERFFLPQEFAALQSLATSQRRETFFKLWTRKEACIKAKGEGLSIPLKRVEVSAALEERAERISITGVLLEGSSSWYVQDLRPGRDYAAAIAVEGDGWQLSCWHWSEQLNGHT